MAVGKTTSKRQGRKWFRLRGRWRWLAILAAVAVLVATIWFDVRSTPLGSRSFIFGGRGLDDGVTGVVVFSFDVEGHSGLQMVDAASGDSEGLDDAVGPDAAPAASADGRQVVYVARSPAANRADSNSGGSGQDVLGDLVVRTLSLVDGTTLDLSVKPGGAPVETPAWSPDGSQVAFIAEFDADPVRSIYVVPAGGGTAQRIGPEPVEQTTCVPEGGFERFTEDGCYQELTGHARGVAWLSDDELVYVAELDATYTADDDEDLPFRWQLFRLGLTDPRPEVLAETESPVDELAVSPDGRYVVYGGGQGDTFLLELANGQTRRLGHGIAEPSWSADGERLVFVDGYNVKTADADGTDITNVTRIPPIRVDESPVRDDLPALAVWSPDRQHIAYASNDGRIYLMNPDGTGQTSITDTDDGEIIGLRWVPTPQ